MTRKTETTEVVYSENRTDGWKEVHKYVTTVTTVLERDEEGYPFTPRRNGYKHYQGGVLVGDYDGMTVGQLRAMNVDELRRFYDHIGAVPAAKKDAEKPKDV